MRIVIATDSFKECLTAQEVGQSIQKGIEVEIPDAIIDVLPMADGGEGTIDALIFATNGKKVELEATDAYGKRRRTYYGVLGDNKTAVIEIAKVVGLETVSKRDPLNATSYGVGELILHALQSGYRKFIITLGGSATNDGGIGMLQALGGKFLDSNGNQVPGIGGALHKIESVDFSEINPLLKECELIVASDVENVLCGPNGATYVFGPQKGAKETDLFHLDTGLSHYSNLVENKLGKIIQNTPGAGAAGGLGFGLLVIGGQINSGAKIVSDAINLEKYIKTADWVITGEGKSDFQTLYGKVPVYVAKIAKKYGVKTILLSGALGRGYQQLYEYFISCHSISNGPMSLEDSIKNAGQLLFDSSRNLARLIKRIH
ncbi:glycerate kinase [Thermolongibacillus altinsuensis]